MKNLNQLSIGEIVAGLTAKYFSPSDIANDLIARYQLTEDRYFAWEMFDAAILKRQARLAEERLATGGVIRSFEAVPFGVKDIFNTSDFPTQMGSPIWKGFTPGNDARTVFNARELGALFPGKTTTAEFAVHALNKTLNPHSPEHTPGTSSSGSAAAVAAGVVPASLGSQTAGSIIRPASFCGVYGMKPSFGLLPRTGMLKTTDSLDTIGFFAAHVEDLRRILHGLRVRGRNYPIVQAKVDSYSPRREGTPWRAAFIKTHTWGDAKKYVKKDILSWLARIDKERDIEIFEVEEPSLLNSAHQVHSIIYDKSLAYYFREEFSRRELISPAFQDIILHGNTISHEEYLGALENQSNMANCMDSLLADFDIFVSIGTSSAAPLRGQMEIADPSLMWTLTYLPTVAVPLFTSPENLPFGLQIGARRYNDYRLLDFLTMLQSRELIPHRCSIID